ncbi:hypothetical protein ACNSOL_11825 (plasmid) [Aliarcobacter lanthieri]|uniref:hypothetical protein n=1 Tax=Aliarcobacter lanthieri TaxID=1355374 RepID=UPI003AAB0398
MTKPINNKEIFLSKSSLNLKDLKNVSKLSSNEQKSLAILVVANMELSSLKSIDKNSVINSLVNSFNRYLPSFKQFDDLFNTYYSEKDIKKKNEIFKKVKPLESIAMYFSEIAQRFNTVPKTTAITKKGFAFNLLLYWFNVGNTKSIYFEFLDEFNFQDEIDKVIQESKKIEDLNKGFRKELFDAFDNSIEIVEFLKKFIPRIYIPKKNGFRSNKNKYM